MIYYHITKGQYVPSILKYGLIPGFKIGFCNVTSAERRSLYPMAVFLTDDADYIIKNQLTNGWIRRFHATILEVDCTDIALVNRFENIYPTSHEYMYYTTIPFMRITLSKAL